MAMNSSIDTLLDKLATDQAFREQMLGDPVGALGSIGITIDPANVPPVRSLPSMDSIKADQAAISEKLENSAGLFFFLLSGKV